MGDLFRKVSREYSIFDGIYYHCKVKYGGMKAADIKRLKEFKEENCLLKHMNAE